MTMQKRYAFLLLPALGVLALACCSTLTSESSCGHGAGRVVDEALCVGRTAASFPAADEDYFRDMDYGVTKNPATVAAELAPYVPGIAPGDATAAAVKGRNNWIVWTGGNDRLWNDLSVESAGILDFLKTVSNHPSLQYSRDTRWRYLGLVNEPCFDKGTRSPQGPVRPVARHPARRLSARSLRKRIEVPGRADRRARADRAGRLVLRLRNGRRRSAAVSESGVR